MYKVLSLVFRPRRRVDIISLERGRSVAVEVVWGEGGITAICINLMNDDNDESHKPPRSPTHSLTLSLSLSHTHTYSPDDILRRDEFNEMRPWGHVAVVAAAVVLLYFWRSHRSVVSHRRNNPFTLGSRHLRHRTKLGN